MAADFKIELTRESKRKFKQSLKTNKEEISKSVMDVLSAVALDILSDSIKNLRDHGNIASGKLLKNGRFKRVKGELATEVVYTGYAGAIEFGRKAGKMPPVDVIAQWVKRKGIATGKSIKSVAFLIARSIAKNGTKSSPFLAPAFNKHVQGLSTKLTKAINDVNK